MEKKRKYSKFLILPIFALILVICSLPISAVSVDGYFSDSAYTYDKMPDNQFATTFPCDVNLMYQLSSGNDNNNIILKTEQYKTIEGAVFEDGTFKSPTVKNTIFDTINQTVYNGSTLGDVIVDLNYLDLYSYKFYTRNLKPNHEKDNNYSRPILQIDTADCVNIQTQSNIDIPYGIMLHANNIVLDRLNSTWYKNSTTIGSISGVALNGVSACGGILVENVPVGWFNSKQIYYDIDVRYSNGLLDSWNIPVNASLYATQLNNGRYNLRIPLIPNEFFNQVVVNGRSDYITLENVNVNFYSGISYAQEGSGSFYVWVIDNVLLTDKNATGIYELGNFDNVSFNENYVNDLMGNVQRDYASRNAPISDGDLNSLTSWVGAAVGGFFGTELFYGITFGGILLICLSFSVLFMFLKYFAGG